MGVNRVKAVATSAMRVAKNAKVLIEAVRKHTGINIEVISGRQEARLIAEGILHFDRIRAPQAVLIDIGGGSTELSLCEFNKRKKSVSLPLGSLRLKQLYLPEQQDLTARLDGVSLLRSEVQKLIAKKLRGWPGRSGHLAVGSSGTIRAVARLLDRQRPKQRPLPPLHSSAKPKTRLRFTRAELKNLVERMLPMSRAQLLRLQGMERRRVDIILAGAILLLELLEFLEIEKVQTSNFALRDGILLSLLR